MLKKLKKQKGKINFDDYESFQYGPLRLERYGKNVILSSDWKAGEFEKHLERVKNERPKLKNEIDKKIKELVKLFKSSNIFHVLSSIATENVFINPEIDTELNFKGKEAYIEYALSIVTGLKDYKLNKLKEDTNIDEIKKLIEQIYDLITWYFASENVNKQDRIEKSEVRFTSLLYFLFVRGNSYYQHNIDLIQKLFEPHNKFLSTKFGTTIEQILILIADIEHQIINNLNKTIKQFSTLKELHKIFIKFTNKRSNINGLSFEEVREKYLALPEVIEKKKDLERDKNKIKPIIFELDLDLTIFSKFLNRISTTLGENEAFLSFKKSPGWPTNNSIIYHKPLLKYNKKYYCFCPKLLSMNLKPILETLIINADTKYYDNNYQKKRAKYLEEKSIEYLKNLLPSADSYVNLHYFIYDNNSKKNAECDGLIIFDNNILIVEAKASSLTLPSRRGSLMSLKEELNEIIDSAYSQALKTKNYILTTDIPVFFNEKGEQVLKISNKEKYSNYYILNVTLDNLSPVATDLHTLKNFNLLDGKEWPWSVFINDLRVISEIIDNQSVFLLYLIRRIQANNFPQFKACDELDFLMYFFHEGLYFTKDDFRDVGKFTPIGYTEDLDKYYLYLEGKVAKCKKPKLNIDAYIIKIIEEIEASKEFGFSEITKTLLGFDTATHQEFLNALNFTISKSISDNKEHDFTILFKDFGFTTIITHNMIRAFPKAVNDYCPLKMYQTKLNQWYCLLIDISNYPQKIYKHKTFYKTWHYNENMENRLQEIKKKIINNIKSENKKIGRNDLCPCGSGLKYKFCCGK